MSSLRWINVNSWASQLIKHSKCSLWLPWTHPMTAMMAFSMNWWPVIDQCFGRMSTHISNPSCAEWKVVQVINMFNNMFYMLILRLLWDHFPGKKFNSVEQLWRTSRSRNRVLLLVMLQQSGMFGHLLSPKFLVGKPWIKMVHSTSKTQTFANWIAQWQFFKRLNFNHICQSVCPKLVLLLATCWHMLPVLLKGCIKDSTPALSSSASPTILAFVGITTPMDIDMVENDLNIWWSFLQVPTPMAQPSWKLLWFKSMTAARHCKVTGAGIGSSNDCICWHCYFKLLMCFEWKK